MHESSFCYALVLLVTLPFASLRSQQPNPFGVRQSDTGVTPSRTRASTDSAQRARQSAAQRAAAVRFAGVDSVVYRLSPSSRFTVKTGKAGLFGFAGHSHLIQARAFAGQVVYYPKTPSRSHLEISVPADRLEVLTPPDTAEIRKVTATMRSDILHVDQYRQIQLVSKQVTPKDDGFHLLAALTLVGQTRQVPIDVKVQLGRDTLRAAATFPIKQTDFGIKPFSGGPGGTVKVADRVMFNIDAIAIRAGEGAAGTRR